MTCEVSPEVSHDDEFENPSGDREVGYLGVGV